MDPLGAFRYNGFTLKKLRRVMAKMKSNIPLGDLVSTDKNMYELTNAAIHRAGQISMAGSEDLEDSGGKIVSLAIKEIVSGEVQYSIKQD